MKLLSQFCLIVCITLCASAVYAHSDLIPEKMVLTSTDNFGIVYTHELKENQTIYGLSKFFNTNMQLISKANPGVELSNVKKFQSVNIPINTDMLISERKLSPTKHYIPVFYTVKAKDNLFRISKVYFNQKIENVMDINQLKTMELSVGQKLLVGWYEYDPIYKSKLAWTDKGIEVDFAGSNATPSQPTVKPYIPVEQRREIALKKNRQEPMKFEKIVSTRPQETVVEHIPERNVNPQVQKTETISTVQTDTYAEKIKEVSDHNTHGTAPEVVSTESIEPTGEKEEKVEGVEMVEEEIVRELSTNPFEARNNIYKGDYDGKPTIKSAKIRAQWNSRSKDKTNLFALHATAKKGSYIEIYNPMLDRMVIAKVVGNIPERIYKNNVELIVSPKVAETLGVVDKKFFVKITFIE